MRVDAHHHLWRYTAKEFAWIDEDAAVLRRDFLPDEFEAAAAESGVDASISVQARCSVEETEWLLECAARSGVISKVVGWVPLASLELPSHLDRFADFARLAGFREIAQDRPTGFLLDPAFNRGLRQLTAHGYTYDILVRAGQLAEAVRFVDLHPKQMFVLDHAGKPEIGKNLLAPWRLHLRRLAERPNVLCKLSGLVTEANRRHWTEEDLRAYLDTCLECFGAERCMAGSDWPVCLAASSYGRWWRTLERWAGRLSQDEQDRIFGLTAASFYQLPI